MTERRLTCLLGMILILVVWSAPAGAHFGMVIPSDTMVMQQDPRTITVTLSFSHPMEMIGMDLARPERFDVMANGRKVSLVDTLKSATVMGHPAWQTTYAIKRPGVYIFAMVPQPYWEPAEDSYIVHYTKSVVTAFGDDSGWDAELGLKTEIVPLAKPFGLYSGNVFQGIVKVDGAPVPNAEVEVEYYNQDRNASAPTEYMITQTIKADGRGVFTYAVPASGWWGFAALSTDKQTRKHDGKDKAIEIGAVIWINFHPWQGK